MRWTCSGLTAAGYTSCQHYHSLICCRCHVKYSAPMPVAADGAISTAPISALPCLPWDSLPIMQQMSSVSAGA